MATTANLYGTKLEVGQANKEVTINEFFDLMDASIGGKLTRSVAGNTNVTLTTTEARNAVLEFTGALTGNINVDIPSSAVTGRRRKYLVYNNTSGAFTLTVRYSGGTGIAVTQGKKRLLYHDGTNVVDAITESGATTTAVVARVSHNANQSILNNTSTVLAFNSESATFDTDPQGCHDTVTNNSRLTVPAGQGGFYIVGAQVSFAFSTGGSRTAFFYHNGVTQWADFTIYANQTTNHPTTFTIVAALPLSAGDYMQVVVNQGSGGALNVETNNYSPRFWWVKVG